MTFLNLKKVWTRFLKVFFIKVVAQAVPTSCFSMAFAFYDGYCTVKLPYTFGIFWHDFENIGHFSKHFGVCCHFGYFWAVVGSYWPHLAFSGSFCNFILTSDIIILIFLC